MTEDSDEDLSAIMGQAGEQELPHSSLPLKGANRERSFTEDVLLLSQLEVSQTSTKESETSLSKIGKPILPGELAVKEERICCTCE